MHAKSPSPAHDGGSSSPQAPGIPVRQADRPGPPRKPSASVTAAGRGLVAGHASCVLPGNVVLPRGALAGMAVCIGARARRRTRFGAEGAPIAGGAGRSAVRGAGRDHQDRMIAAGWPSMARLRPPDLHARGHRGVGRAGRGSATGAVRFARAAPGVAARLQGGAEAASRRPVGTRRQDGVRWQRQQVRCQPVRKSRHRCSGAVYLPPDEHTRRPGAGRSAASCPDCRHRVATSLVVAESAATKLRKASVRRRRSPADPARSETGA